MCGERFDLLDGLELLSDVTFMQYALRSNYILFGETEIVPGEAKIVNLPKDFSEVHKIIITPYGLHKIHCVPVKSGSYQFLILSSKVKGHEYLKQIRISWAVYGNRQGEQAPLWRQLLSSAKAFEIEKNFRMEIVEVETAFEVFISSYLRSKLQKLASHDVVELIFDRFHRMEDVTTRLFEAATGKTLRKMLDEANRQELYGKWKGGVKDKRDAIVHAGVNVGSDEAKEAFETVFEIVLFLKPQALNYLYSSVAMDESISKRLFEDNMKGANQSL